MKSAGRKSVTDLSYLRKMAMDDEEIIIQTAEAFLKDTPHNQKDLQNCFACGKWDELAKVAHKIKPNLKYMGMTRASELIIEIEDQAKSGEVLVGLKEKIQDFNKICDLALQELSVKVEHLKKK